MATSTAPDLNWPLLVSLQQQALTATDSQTLSFTIANDTWHLVSYRQALVFVNDALERPRLRAVSGLISVLDDTPFTLWAGQVGAHLARVAATQSAVFTAHDLPDALHADWGEWWEAHALYQPLLTPAGQMLGAVIYVRDAPWTAPERDALTQLHVQYAYCLAHVQRRIGLLARWRAQRWRMLWWGVLALLLVGVAAIPVRLSALAPGEIIALQSEVVAAPMEGVIRNVHVRPNQPVSAGQRLFSLDDTTLRNRLDIAREALAVAETEALKAEQKAFDHFDSKAELAALRGHVREKQAEVLYIEALLGRVEITAPHAGVLIYGDPNDWLGKPVVTGERIAQLAQPNALGVLIWLPVNDAIALQLGALIRVYLQVSPLDALEAELIQTSYQATLSPEGIAAYRLRGRLQTAEPVHIGLRGVAKIYGESQPLLYWILRRPLGALRQWVGI
ncbi:Biotin-lipoyl like [Allochromatium warmingii]|uniref:Biotin-lipoyl like n=1 Tax=Allochromatium warmingii TaxID=61595 RepID=A0A1H3GLB2_ALLWA|nr:biotin/lipoyl-binding protein [Allochromatium warmingii]SDY03850.1 Biotin-lipoyl like [Allochromatium warmingii]